MKAVFVCPVLVGTDKEDLPSGRGRQRDDRVRHKLDRLSRQRGSVSGSQRRSRRQTLANAHPDLLRDVGLVLHPNLARHCSEQNA